MEASNLESHFNGKSGGVNCPEDAFFIVIVKCWMAHVFRVKQISYIWRKLQKKILSFLIKSS